MKFKGTGVRAHANGGHQDSVLFGKSRPFPSLDKIWHNPESIANIDSLAHVFDHYHCVTMDTDINNTIMFVHLKNRALRFEEASSGL
jgi:hypothetical protein